MERLRLKIPRAMPRILHPAQFSVKNHPTPAWRPGSGGGQGSGSGGTTAPARIGGPGGAAGGATPHWLQVSTKAPSLSTHLILRLHTLPRLLEIVAALLDDLEAD